MIINFSNLGGGGGQGGGIPEAPNDGKQYARQSKNWSEVKASGDKLVSVADMPEDLADGDVVAIQTPVYSNVLQWSNTGGTSQFSGTWLTHTFVLENPIQIRRQEWYGSRPQFWLNTDGTIDLKIKYSDQTGEDLDLIATMTMGESGETVFYTDTGGTQNSTTFTWNWTNEDVFTINFNRGSMACEYALNPSLQVGYSSRLVKYRETPGTWAKWVGSNDNGYEKNINFAFHYSVIPEEFDGAEICNATYFTQDQYREHFYFDLANNQILVKKSETGTTDYVITLNGPEVTVTLNSYHIIVKWVDGLITFKKDNIYVTFNKVINTFTSGLHFELADDNMTLAATPNENYGAMRFPYWNNQGQIVGSADGDMAVRSCYLNTTGYSNNMALLSKGGTVPQRLWIPTASGETDTVLVSAGGNAAPVFTNFWNKFTAGIHFWQGTEEEYDAIATKDPNTFYIITD